MSLRPEFWEHVERVRDNPAVAETLAHRYVRYDARARVTVLAHCLRRAAEVVPAQAKVELQNLGMTAYWEEAPQTMRTKRAGILAKFELGAARVARRGAGRCIAPDCPAKDQAGRSVPATVRGDSPSDYCESCERRYAEAHTAPDYLPEADRAKAEYSLFESALPQMLYLIERTPARVV